MMKTIFSGLLFLTFSAYAAPQAIHGPSLQDLPKKWKGVAGGLLQKTEAELEIKQITGIQKDPNSDYVSYFVNAEIRLNERTLKIQRIDLSTPIVNSAQNFIEAYFQFNDELAIGSQLTIRYDEVKDLYTMADIAKNGERRFFFTAPKSR